MSQDDSQPSPSQSSDPPLSKADKLGLALQTILELVPLGIGSAINTAVFGTMAVRQTKRLEAVTQALAEDLKRIADKVDKTYFESDEFQTLFRKTLESASKEHQETKLLLMKNVLARNILEGERGRFDLDAYVLELIAGLTVLHLLCLRELAQPTQSGRGGMPGFLRPDEIAARLGVDSSFAAGILGHLKSLGLAYGQAGMGRMGPTMISADSAFALSETGELILSRLSNLPRSQSEPESSPSTPK